MGDQTSCQATPSRRQNKVCALQFHGAFILALPPSLSKRQHCSLCCQLSLCFSLATSHAIILRGFVGKGHQALKPSTNAFGIKQYICHNSTEQVSLPKTNMSLLQLRFSLKFGIGNTTRITSASVRFQFTRSARLPTVFHQN